MEKMATCQKCGKTLEQKKTSISNWMMNKTGYLCGECQGLSDYPTTITGYTTNGKPAIIVKTKA